MNRLPILFLLVIAGIPGAAAASAARLTSEAANSAQFDGKLDTSSEVSPLVLKLQVLLDRVHASPGVIDGRYGDNVGKAISAYRAMRGLEPTTALDTETWKLLTKAAGDGNVLVDYTVTEKDIAGPYVEIPDDYRKMSKLKRLSYSSPEEMLAERFHMDIDLLKGLNPEADFSSAGTRIVVAGIGKTEPAGQIARVVANKKRGTLEAFDGAGKIIVAYPASIGSKATPSPEGEHTVRAVAMNPAYYYNPDVNFVTDGIREKLKLPPGPNGPVGSVWIDLSKETYGIHGTPDPAKIDKEFSHGCVRLTNWDAEELAKLVKPGVKVVFE